MDYDGAMRMEVGGLDPATRQAERMAILERRIAAVERAQSMGIQRVKATNSATLSLAPGAVDTASGPTVTIAAAEGSLFFFYIQQELRKLTGGVANGGILMTAPDASTLTITPLIQRGNTAFAGMANLPGNNAGMVVPVTWTGLMTSGGPSTALIPPVLTEPPGDYTFAMRHSNDGTAGNSEHRNRIIGIIAI